MAPFPITRTVVHPYAASSPAHTHFGPTPFRIPAYSAPCIPFRWMRRDEAAGIAASFEIPWADELEDRARKLMGFESGWVQERDNQKALLDVFFSAIQPGRSLCFIYAKSTPLSEENRRVLIGVGRVAHVGPSAEYEYTSAGVLRSMLWERAVQHSIRPGFADGFILPYHQILALADQDQSIDPAEYVAYAPDERWEEFAYTSEHVAHDSAIASLLSCREALIRAVTIVSGDWETPLKWIDARLGELWKMRGPYPGLGAALTTFGVDHGHLVAYDIASDLRENEDPWESLEAAMADPSLLRYGLDQRLSGPVRAGWRRITPERKALLQLLARFDLTADQAKRFFHRSERTKARIEVGDRALLENPYLLYELDRHAADPIGVKTVDRGVFPDLAIRDAFPVPSPSALDGGVDPRRVRALTVDILEGSARLGNTLESRDSVIQTIRDDHSLSPDCPVSEDLMPQAEETFSGTVDVVALANGAPAYQLTHLATVRKLIQGEIDKRAIGVRHQVAADWADLLDRELVEHGPFDDAETKARTEKVAALAELAASRVSVLIGAAGTGKTTLLAALCRHPYIQGRGVRLLAPTGKARVRLQTGIGKHVTMPAQTIAQFLRKSDRYDDQTGRYYLNPSAPTVQDAATLIVDEASMLTEEMLGALLDGVRGVQRLILVGDFRQLPPIGSGRPFVDIVRRLAPDKVEGQFPRVGQAYAELTIRHRQKQLGSTPPELHDLLLADWFSGQAQEPAADEIWERIARNELSTRVKLVSWETAEDLHERLLDVLVDELDLASRDDAAGFEQSVGGTLANGWVYFNRGKTVEAVESWQILSPLRGQAHGIADLNRFIQRHFRKRAHASATVKGLRRVPKPFGTEAILYGDKVINTINQTKKYVYPKTDALEYVANGEIGVVVGQFRGKDDKTPPWKLEVEFSSQPGFAYDYLAPGFSDENDAPLELAYAITVHRAQGSEFGSTILVLPKDCRPLSRELLYTALTRQRNRVVILHQGPLTELKRYAAPSYSDTARRLTNLFGAPEPVEVEPRRFLEKSLINRTARGELVRSKAEVIIADLLRSRGVDYQYEAPLGSRFPDFTVDDAASGRTVYWEHLGMLEDPAYRARWQHKLVWYRDQGIVPYTEDPTAARVLVITEDNPQHGIDAQAIARLVDAVFA